MTDSNTENTRDLFTRRDFTILSVGTAAMAVAGSAMAATSVKREAVSIETPDGIMDAMLLGPEGAGSWPGVIFYPDAMGLRPAMTNMAARLAGDGYVVLAINQFYRTQPAPITKPGFSFSNPDDRAWIMKMIDTLNPTLVTRDAGVLIAYLDSLPQVNSKAKLGAVGFCMGGAMTIRAAALAPDRVGAVVSFHGGGLVTDAPDSPHRLIAQTKAVYHIGISADDDAKEPEAKKILKKTFADAGRPASVEVYPDTKHGWTVTDQEIYDPVQAERAWATMLDLYRRALA